MNCELSGLNFSSTSYNEPRFSEFRVQLRDPALNYIESRDYASLHLDLAIVILQEESSRSSNGSPEEHFHMDLQIASRVSQRDILARRYLSRLLITLQSVLYNRIRSNNSSCLALLSFPSIVSQQTCIAVSLWMNNYIRCIEKIKLAFIVQISFYYNVQFKK